MSLSSLISSTFSPLQVIVTILVALIVGLMIFFVYKKTFSGVMYSRNFNISLVMLTMVTALMLMIISSSITLSLGMVGALSIVRFRTAIKEPVDTVFMFWAVGEGIATGTKFYDVALISTVVIGLILIVMSLLKVRSASPYLLILHYHEGCAQQIKGLTKQLPGLRLKSKTVQREGVEVTYEVRLKENETGFVDKLLRIEGVYDATLVSHRGDIVA